MDTKQLRLVVGKNIRHYRESKGLTQKELGDRIGVQNNTVSAYERGTTALGQDTLFQISNVLNVKVDDLFPDKQGTTNELERALRLTNDLELKDMEFLNTLIEKTLSLDEEEREKFLESIRFTVDYYNKMN